MYEIDYKAVRLMQISHVLQDREKVSGEPRFDRVVAECFKGRNVDRIEAGWKKGAVAECVEALVEIDSEWIKQARELKNNKLLEDSFLTGADVDRVKACISTYSETTDAVAAKIKQRIEALFVDLADVGKDNIARKLLFRLNVDPKQAEQYVTYIVNKGAYRIIKYGSRGTFDLLDFSSLDHWMAYFYVTVKNVWYDRIKRNEKEGADGISDISDVEELIELYVQDSYDAVEEVMEIAKDDADVTIIRMLAHGYNHTEIAVEIGRSKSRVSQRIREMRKRLALLNGRRWGDV